jgi:hypothetical protein
MTLAQVETHEPRGLLKLAPPFWGLPRIASWLIAYLAEVQALEDAVWSYLDGLDVDTCERWVLERLASIVGETARPDDTEALRLYVKARILVNRSDGTPGAIAEVIQVLTDGEVHVLDHSEEVRVLQYTSPPTDADVAAEILDDAVTAGKQSVWLTGCGDGSIRFPAYGAAGDASRRFGVGTWPAFHGSR